MKHYLATLFCFLVVFGAKISLTTSESMAREVWSSTHFRDHKLVGKIWSTATKSFISYDQLLANLTKARFVLLGETHTNKDHHLLQARILDDLTKSLNSPPGLVVEMIPDSYGIILDQFRKDQPDDTEKLGAILKWKKRGWGDWANYQPIFDIALRHKLAILPGNLDRQETKKISRKGISSLNEEQQKKLSLDLEYTKPQSLDLTEVLFSSHCKLVPRDKLSSMLLVQRARDGYMAEKMLVAGAHSQAVLIAGSGHVRLDWASPRILRARQPDSTIVSLSFIEVNPKVVKPGEYLPASSDKKPVFDYLYFTPKSEIKDHCAELIKMFKKHKKN